MRKPIQIVADNGKLYALADDGTLWVNANPTVDLWLTVIALPQSPTPGPRPQADSE